MRFGLLLIALVAVPITLSAQERGEKREKSEAGKKKGYAEVNTDTSTEVALGYEEYTLHNLETLNSPSLEYGPSVTADGKTLYFVSNRSGGFGGHDIWSAVKASPTSIEFSAPLNIGEPVNTSLNEGVVSIAPDGLTIYFTGCNRPDGAGDCDLYEARLYGETWQDVRNLGAVNSSYWDSQPSISGSGDTLYFLSNRPGAMGGADDADIYMTVRGVGGEWQDPVNVGEPINTVRREDSPFVLPGSNRLYFSSAGHGGYGKLDFFVAEQGEDGTWGEPQNLGPVFNSSLDERMLSGSLNDGIFYFASERKTPANLGTLDLFIAVRQSSGVTEDPLASEGLTRIEVGPNPAQERITVHVWGSIAENETVEIVNARGESVLRFSLEEARKSVSIESLPSGFYFAKVGGKTTTFVVRR